LRPVAIDPRRAVRLSEPTQRQPRIVLARAGVRSTNAAVPRRTTSHAAS